MKKSILLIIATLVSMATFAQRLHYRPIHIGKEYTSGHELRVGSLETAPLPNVGSPKVPVILVQFPDSKFSCDILIDNAIEHSDENVHNYYEKFCNGTGNPDEDYMATIGNVGPVRDYFEKQSSGKFSPEFVVIGPVTLPESYRYYGEDGNPKDFRINEFYETSLRLAIETGIDMNQFDNNKDGVIDFAFFIYAGAGQNEYNDKEHSYLIWPKEITTKTTITVNDDKGNSKDYIFAGFGCTCEISWGNPTIGTMCHELSHGLGLPDFYDTNHKAFGLDHWGLMDNGDVCFDGKCPAGYSTYELDFMKWRELKTIPLTGKQTITLEPVSKGGVGYKLVNPDNENEYYILENRQCDGYDQYLGWELGSWRTKYGANTGLLITHVDYDKKIWELNRANSDIKHPRFTILPADEELISCLISFSTDYSMSMRGDLYPGSKNVTSVPSERFELYTGGYLPVEITNIVENEDGTITVELQEVEETELPVIRNFQGNEDLWLNYDGTTYRYNQYFHIDDGKDLNITKEFIAKGIYFSYYPKTEIFTTILPYDVPFSKVKADIYSFSGFDGKDLHFIKQNTADNSDGVMKANTPYLLKIHEYGLQFDMTLSAEIKTTTSPEDYVVNVGEATHFGTYKTQHYYCGEEAEDGDYYYDYYAYIDNRFYRVLDLTVPAMHTGIRLKKNKEDGNRLKAASDESYGLVLHDGDYTTLVSPGSEKSFNGKVNVYDVTGRAIRLNVDEEKSLEGLKEGIYFVNDKKVMVK
ncbi:MAG: M6 family metalloprotease domain-containing protein [Bacteroidales bacterium]|nr:M6 family metalloprotease domain-containing protein [Candidatus Physcocola equi]